MEVIAEEEDLLQAAITYAYTKHAGDEVMYPPDASKAKRRTICERAQNLIKQNGKLFYTSILCKLLYTCVTQSQNWWPVTHLCIFHYRYTLMKENRGNRTMLYAKKHAWDG